MQSSNKHKGRKKRDFDHKITIIGPGQAGKTTLLKYLVEAGNFAQTTPTFGLQLEKVSYRGIDFLVFDIGGQVVFVHTFWKTHVQTADAVIFVVDASDPNSIRSSRDYLRYVSTWIQQVPLMILGNKQDLTEAVEKDELLERIELPELLLSLPVSAIQLFDVSAKTGQGVFEAFDWLAQRLNKIPTASKFTIRKIVVFNAVIGTPISELRDKVNTDQKTYLEWARGDLSKNNEDETVDEYVTDETVIFSGVISAIDMMSHFLGAQSLKSITLEGKDNTNFVLIKESREDITCVILCEEGDDLSLVREIGNKVLNWIFESQNPYSLSGISVKRFTDKVDDFIGELYRFSPAADLAKSVQKRNKKVRR
ncbi:MAG: ADP-ribosylation factor-like protein [Candidatus Hodarchaeales archaeon]|jgi:small GTP-binding protein